MTTARYFLTLGAVDDIRELGEWFLKRWGKDKTVQYLTELHQGLEYVADRDGANLRPDRLMVGYAADTDRYTCTER